MKGQNAVALFVLGVNVAPVPLSARSVEEISNSVIPDPSTRGCLSLVYTELVSDEARYDHMGLPRDLGDSRASGEQKRWQNKGQEHTISTRESEKRRLQIR